MQGNIKGEVGDPGQPGAPGENGEPGSDGTNSYIYIRYSANADGTGFDATPTPAKKYMGVYAGPSSTAPTNKTSYAWVKYIGEDGLGAGDMLKSTYDTDNDGIVDMAEGLNGLTTSIEELNYIDGVTENVQTALDAKQPTTNDLTAETALDNADTVPFYDVSATANRKSTWSNIKSVLKTYFDTLYNNYNLPTASDSVKGGIKIGNGLVIDSEIVRVDKYTFANVAVATTDFVTYTATLTGEADLTTAGYVRKAHIASTGVTADHEANVVFGAIEADNGNYASIVTTEAGYVNIYAKAVPASAITIPTIDCTYKGV